MRQGGPTWATRKGAGGSNRLFLNNFSRRQGQSAPLLLPPLIHVNQKDCSGAVPNFGSSISASWRPQAPTFLFYSYRTSALQTELGFIVCRTQTNWGRVASPTSLEIQGHWGKKKKKSDLSSQHRRLHSASGGLTLICNVRLIVLRLLISQLTPRKRVQPDMKTRSVHLFPDHPGDKSAS